MPVGIPGRSDADSVIRRARAVLSVRRGHDDRCGCVDRRRVRTVASGGAKRRPDGRRHAGGIGSTNPSAADCRGASIDADRHGAGCIVIAASECVADAGRRRTSRTTTARRAAVGADNAAFYAVGAATSAATPRRAA